MSICSDVAQQIGDQWIASPKRTEQAATAVSTGIGSAAARVKLRNQRQTF
jgi:hypothetical protein